MSKGGRRRDFFLYRDLGIAGATGGQVICHLVKANPDMPPEDGTGWHKHECDFQIVIMTKGWARFMYLEVTNRLPGGINLFGRPLAAADHGGSGYSALYRGSADI